MNDEFRTKIKILLISVPIFLLYSKLFLYQFLPKINQSINFIPDTHAYLLLDFQIILSLQVINKSIKIFSRKIGVLEKLCQQLL